MSVGGTDNIKTSMATTGIGNINANRSQFQHECGWFSNGRAADLKAQAGGPSPIRDGLHHELAVDVLQSIPAYVAEFKKVFGSDKVTIDG